MTRRFASGVGAAFLILAGAGVLFAGPLTARPGHVAAVATDLPAALLALID